MYSTELPIVDIRLQCCTLYRVRLQLQHHVLSQSAVLHKGPPAAAATRVDPARRVQQPNKLYLHQQLKLHAFFIKYQLETLSHNTWWCALKCTRNGTIFMFYPSSSTTCEVFHRRHFFDNAVDFRWEFSWRSVWTSWLSTQTWFCYFTIECKCILGMYSDSRKCFVCLHKISIFIRLLLFWSHKNTWLQLSLTMQLETF